MRLDTLRKYSVVDVEGLFLNVPLLLFEYNAITRAVENSTPYIMVLVLLFVLGLFFNKYTGTASILLLGYLAYTLNLNALLFASIWLTSIAISNKTRFLDKLLSYMFILSFNAYLLPGDQHIYLFVTMIPVLLYLSTTLSRLSVLQLSVSLILASIIVALSKITGSILTLNMFVFTIATAIYLAYNTIEKTTKEA